MRRRGLNGILAEHDAAEDGSRELAGEWVDAREEGAKDEERVILYLHGGKPISAFGPVAPALTARIGAYYLFSPATHRRITVPLSRTTNARVFCKSTALQP